MLYNPSDDTFLLADSIVNYKGNYALEIGTGSGYLTAILCENYKFVVGTDIDFESVQYSKYFLNKFNNKFLICCDICEPIRLMFDIIVCNPPYLPLNSKKNLNDDHAIYGGVTGLETTLKVLKLCKSNLNNDGKIVFIKSSLSNYDKFDLFVKDNLLKIRTLATKRYFFENLEVYEITK
jgi:release factor glutamine methyltransferase